MGKEHEIWTRDDEATVRRLIPVVRRACVSSPAHTTRVAITNAAARTIPRRSIIFFPGFLLGAAAALLLLALTAWLAVLPRLEAQRNMRLASIVDDAMFLCTEGTDVNTHPAPESRDLAERLLMLQGLDTVTAPAPEAAQPASLLSTEIQSRNTTALLAQRCG